MSNKTQMDQIQLETPNYDKTYQEKGNQQAMRVLRQKQLATNNSTVKPEPQV